MNIIKPIPVICNIGDTNGIKKSYGNDVFTSPSIRKYENIFHASCNWIKILEPEDRIYKSKINNKWSYFVYEAKKKKRNTLCGLKTKTCTLKTIGELPRLIFPNLISLFLICILPDNVVLPESLLYLYIFDRTYFTSCVQITGQPCIKPVVLPQNLIEARLKYNRITIIGNKLKLLKFGRMHLESTIIPKNSHLEYLKLGYFNTKKIELPDSLKVLRIGIQYEHSLKIPPNLILFHLLNGEYDKILKLPDSLRYLVLNNSQTVLGGERLPSNLEFFQPGFFSKFEIPSKLRILEFSSLDKYDHDFNFPNTLTHLIMPGKYKQKTKDIILPESLVFLKIPSYWMEIPKLPPNLKVLGIGPDRRGTIIYKITRKTKLIFFGIYNYTIDLHKNIEYLCLGLVCPKLGDEEYCVITYKIYKKKKECDCILFEKGFFNDKKNYNSHIDDFNTSFNEPDMNTTDHNPYIDDGECIFLIWTRKRPFSDLENDYQNNSDENDSDFGKDELELQSVDPKLNLDKDVLYMTGKSCHRPYWGPTIFNSKISSQ